MTAIEILRGKLEERLALWEHNPRRSDRIIYDRDARWGEVNTALALLDEAIAEADSLETTTPKGKE